MGQRKDPLPDFFILGAAKCGTASLYNWLAQHPDVCMSKPKEPLFFEAEFHRGMDYYWEKCFAHYKGQKVVGDARHRNLFLPYVPERIYSVAPRARFVVLVRNPIDRAMSHWWMIHRRSFDMDDFETAVRRNLERLSKGLRMDTPDEIRRYERELPKDGLYPNYVDTGYYAEQIERYYKRFSREQLKVFLLEDLIKDPKSVVREVFGHIGVNPEECERVDYTVKNEGRPEMRWYRGLRQWFWNLLPYPGHPPRYVSLSAVRTRPSMSPEFRKFLGDHFKPYNQQLAALLGRNLDHWV